MSHSHQPGKSTIIAQDMNDNLTCNTQRFSYDVFLNLGRGVAVQKIRRGREEAERVKGKREEGRGKEEVESLV